MDAIGTQAIKNALHGTDPSVVAARVLDVIEHRHPSRTLIGVFDRIIRALERVAMAARPADPEQYAGPYDAALADILAAEPAGELSTNDWRWEKIADGDTETWRLQAPIDCRLVTLGFVRRVELRDLNAIWLPLLGDECVSEELGEISATRALGKLTVEDTISDIDAQLDARVARGRSLPAA